MDIKKIVGANIRAFREQRGLTQVELGKKANIHSVYIGGIERGVRNATLTNLHKIAKALDIPTYVLLTEEANSWLKARKAY